MYSLQYHIVFCTKYRRQVLTGLVKTDLEKLLYGIADEYNFTITELSVQSDHVHMLLDCKPQFYISDMVKIIKGNTARRLFIDHPELKAQLYGDHLWNPSYCAVTVSDHSHDMVKHYISTQEQR